MPDKIKFVVLVPEDIAEEFETEFKAFVEDFYESEGITVDREI